ncbi:MAG: C13 family peptidase [Nannocystaceae bacterium]
MVSEATEPTLTTRAWVRLVGSLGLFVAACRPPAAARPEAPVVDDPFADLPYASGPLPAAVKVFLVAGGDDVANFAADVIEQRTLWAQAGLRADEIACYYAKPSPQALLEDGEQLAALAPLLRDCYAAEPATLHAHLRQAAGRAPPYLYLFVSGHGLPPLLRWHAGVQDVRDLPARMHLRQGEVARFDRHAIGLEGGPAPGLGQVERMLETHRAGAPVESLVFTPDTLAAALAPLPEASPLIVVLQACFSGGFIGSEDDGPSALVRRPRTTVLTAATPDRPSFGCSPGAQHTYYGGALGRVLARMLEDQPRSPEAMPWAEIHGEVRFIVETIEHIDGERPSQPQLHDGSAGPIDL